MYKIYLNDVVCDQGRHWNGCELRIDLSANADNLAKTLSDIISSYTYRSNARKTVKYNDCDLVFDTNNGNIAVEWHTTDGKIAWKASINYRNVLTLLEEVDKLRNNDAIVITYRLFN